jgi:hypothetical protein
MYIYISGHLYIERETRFFRWSVWGDYGR